MTAKGSLSPDKSARPTTIASLRDEVRLSVPADGAFTSVIRLTGSLLALRSGCSIASHDAFCDMLEAVGTLLADIGVGQLLLTFSLSAHAISVDFSYVPADPAMPTLRAISELPALQEGLLVEVVSLDESRVRIATSHSG